MDINEITLYLAQEQGSEGIICCFQELSSSSQHENTKPIDIGFSSINLRLSIEVVSVRFNILKYSVLSDI